MCMRARGAYVLTYCRAESESEECWGHAHM